MKWFLMFLVFGLIGCENLINPIPGYNSSNNIQVQQINPQQKLNQAFLKNIEGNWTNSTLNPSGSGFLVNTMTHDGHFFFTNKSNPDGSFTLTTNYSFYSAQSETMGIFTNKDSKKYIGFRKYEAKLTKEPQLGIEVKGYDSPDRVNSSSGYVLYGKK